jgi:hypothetical protein
MTSRWRRLAGYLAAAVVVGIAPVPAHGHTDGCERVVSISPQVSGGEGTGSLTFEVYSTGCAAAGEVEYRVEFGSASPTDVEMAGGRLRWATGDTGTRRLTARLRADSVGEPAIEDFTVHLTATTPTVRVAVATGHGRILDDDGPALNLVIDNGLCPKAIGVFDCECTEGMPKACLSVSLSTPVGGSTSPVTIKWSTVDGTARAGVDYLPVVDQVTTVPVGAAHVVLPVWVLSTAPWTPTRWFRVEISASAPWSTIDAVAVVTILGT